MKKLVFLLSIVFAYIALGNLEMCPVSENSRGHENIEWSISYAYALADETRDLPRVHW